MARRLHSTLILAGVFIFGISAGVGTMLWVWPAVSSKVGPPRVPRTQEQIRAMVVDNIKKVAGPLSDDQMKQLQEIIQDTQVRRKQLQDKYAPMYEKPCQEIMDIRSKEWAEFPAISGDENNKIRGVLGDEKYEKWKQDQATHGRGPGMHRPAGCPQPPNSTSGGNAAPGAPHNPPLW